MTSPYPVTLIGGGMIVNDQILPTLYQLRRGGQIGSIRICARHSAPLRALAESATLREAFPDQSFEAWPPLDTPPDAFDAGRYRECLRTAPPHGLTVVAVPDQLHFEIVMEALRRDQHVLCVKPLALRHAHAAEIAREARARGLLVVVEYHKRFDRRSLVAKRQYAAGHFGAFAMGEAKLIEPYYYRHSNFQNWFTRDQTDPFVYIGCHYVDLVTFITGLLPTAVSVVGVPGRFPNGNEAYLWTHARVRFENGAILSVVNGLGYPDDGAGSNDQGLVMYCEGRERTGLIQHNDQDRGVRYCYLEGIGPGGSRYNYVSPDYFRLVPWEGVGARPVGYGYDSIAAFVEAVARVEAAPSGDARQHALAAVDAAGLLATPANSAFNELVVEAGRLSIAADGAWAEITYAPEARATLKGASHG